MPMVPNNDARHMQPLPWKIDPREPGRCVDISSASGKAVCSFWGGVTRDVKDFEWCTEQQMIRHANYGEHAMNNFPIMQSALEEIYNMEDMPEDAIKRIEEIMGKVYLNMMEMPPLVATKR